MLLKDLKNTVLDPLTDKEIQVKDKEPAIHFMWRGKAYKAVITED